MVYLDINYYSTKNKILLKNYGILQQAFGKIANFVVNSRLFLARNFIFDRK